MRASGLDEVMTQMRQGEVRSNLRDIHLYDHAPIDAVRHIGHILRGSASLSNKEYRLNFDPAQEIVVQKMLYPEALARKVVIEATDFFAGVIALDYYSAIIARNYNAMDEVCRIAVDLERQDRNLDPTLQHIGQAIKADAPRVQLVTSGDNSLTRRFRRTYNDANNADLPSNAYARDPGTLYMEAAKIVTSCVRSQSDRLKTLHGPMDIRALIYIDAMMPHVDEDVKEVVRGQMDQGDYLKASLIVTAAAALDHYRQGLTNILEQYT
ncbi:MAG: hypothetical protein ABIH41_04835 [Nanoarchaeota archaeon]